MEHPISHASRPRIIAELGINHDGSETTARALIDAAARARAWGVKFQYRNIANTYAAGAQEIGDEILKKEIERNYLSPEAVLRLTAYAQDQALKCGISFFTPEDFGDFGSDIDLFDFFKVPSVEFTNMALIEKIESCDKPGLISTGAYTENIVETTLRKLMPGRWTPLHCVSNYPVALTSPKLGYLIHLRELWGNNVGYSSHDDHWEVCLLAMQLGARVVERHITLDKTAEGLDHSSSSTPDEFEKLTAFAEMLELILAGNGPRVPNQGELLNLQNLGRSYYARSTIPEGKPIAAESLVLRAPRTGLGQEEMRAFIGKPAIRSVNSGDVIDRSIFERPAPLPDDVLDFARMAKLSIPVRLHDMEAMESRFPIGRFEFHLSFGEAAGTIETSDFSKEHRYSIHLPDYVSPTQLMDPFSPAKTQRTNSLRILERTVEFAKRLQNLTGDTVPIVGSFSVVHTTLEHFFDQHTELLSRYRQQGVEILPQWLPPVAWYFGGAVRIDAMNNVPDIEQIKSHATPICMDVCHLCMGDKVFDFEAIEVVKELSPLTRHVHIADASGYDGEGLPFGNGDAGNMEAIAAAMTLPCTKVIEVWQGHLHGGAGFAKALVDLRELFHDHV